MAGSRWRRALELAAELDQGAYTPRPEIQDLLGELLAGDEVPDVAEVLCLADLLEDAGLWSSAAAVLDFGRRAYPAAADQVRIVLTTAQHAVDRGDDRRAVALLMDARGLDSAIDVSLASLALAIGDRALARDVRADVPASTEELSPPVRAALAEVDAQLSGAAETAWEGENLADRAVSRFEAARAAGNRHAQRESLTALETVAMLATAELGATHPDAARAQVLADLAGFEFARASGRQPLVAEARERLRASAGRQLASFGALHPEVVATQISLAAAEFETARLQHDIMAALDALVRLDHARTEAELALGSRHPGTITAETNFAIAQLELLYVQEQEERDTEAASHTAESLGALEQRADEVLGHAHPTAVALRRMTRVARALATPGTTDEEGGGDVAVRSRRSTLVDFGGPPAFFGGSAYESVDRAASRLTDDPAEDNDLTRRNNLAVGYEAAGQVNEAIDLFQQVLMDQRRLLGDGHRHTVTTRHNLALAYRTAGRTAEAIASFEQVLADQRRLLGDSHRHTLRTRHNLASAYLEAGRPAESITLYEQVLADQRLLVGDNDPDALTTRHNLAGAYQSAGRVAEAITLYEQVLAGSDQVLGLDHEETLTTRHNLAGAYRVAGRRDEAVALYEQVLADRRRVLGVDHPDTRRTEAMIRELEDT